MVAAENLRGNRVNSDDMCMTAMTSATPAAVYSDELVVPHDSVGW